MKRFGITSIHPATNFLRFPFLFFVTILFYFTEKHASQSVIEIIISEHLFFDLYFQIKLYFQDVY